MCKIKITFLNGKRGWAVRPLIKEGGKLGKKPEDKKPSAPIAFGMP
jgi:hypothetical protein